MTHRPLHGSPTMSKTKLNAVLYRGTFCNRVFMNKLESTIKDFGFKVTQVCWTKSANPFDYLNVGRYNIQKGNFDLVVGHSAGGFPAALTRITGGGKRIGINPFLTQYPFMDMVFHAEDDWLVPPDLGSREKVTLYKGRHSTVPTNPIKSYIQSNF